MIAEIRMALKYSDTLPEAVQLIEQIRNSLREDGTMSRQDRGQLMADFWAFVKTVQVKD
jgi:hypothetical protein